MGWNSWWSVKVGKCKIQSQATRQAHPDHEIFTSKPRKHETAPEVQNFKAAEICVTTVIRTLRAAPENTRWLKLSKSLSQLKVVVCRPVSLQELSTEHGTKFRVREKVWFLLADYETKHDDIGRSSQSCNLAKGSERKDGRRIHRGLYRISRNYFRHNGNLWGCFHESRSKACDESKMRRDLVYG